MNDTIAVIVSAIITAMATIIATRFNEIMDFLKSSPRSIDGVWDGETYMIKFGEIDDTKIKQPREPNSKYIAKLKQSGIRITGTFTMLERQDNLTLYEHSYKGYIKGDYFIYDMLPFNSKQIRLSSAMLFIENTGDFMTGYFVTNGGKDDLPKRLLLGYTIMKKRR